MTEEKSPSDAHSGSTITYRAGMAFRATPAQPNRPVQPDPPQQPGADAPKKSVTPGKSATTRPTQQDQLPNPKANPNPKLKKQPNTQQAHERATHTPRMPMSLGGPMRYDMYPLNYPQIQYTTPSKPATPTNQDQIPNPNPKPEKQQNTQAPRERITPNRMPMSLEGVMRYDMYPLNYPQMQYMTPAPSESLRQQTQEPIVTRDSDFDSKSTSTSAASSSTVTPAKFRAAEMKARIEKENGHFNLNFDQNPYREEPPLADLGNFDAERVDKEEKEGTGREGRNEFEGMKGDGMSTCGNGLGRE